MKEKNNPFARRATFSQWYGERVRFSDTDMLGHVNNAALATYFESGRTECILKIVDKEVKSGYVFVIAQLNIGFLREARWPGVIDIGTGILAIGRTSFTVGQALFDGDDCIATAEAVVVVIDSQTRNSVPIPDWLRERLASLSLKL